jgi:hypothetical protein
MNENAYNRKSATAVTGSLNMIIFFEMSNITWNISVSRVDFIHDITIELVLSSLSVSCVFVPADCWFIEFGNMSYRAMSKHKMLCFATQVSFRGVTDD